MSKAKKAPSAGPKVNTKALSGIREELRLVTWPTRQEAIQLTVTVLTISLIVAAIVGIIDVLLAKVLEALSQI